MTLRPDPSFYPSPRPAKEAPPEKLAYVSAIDPAGIAGAKGGEPDALAVANLDPVSPGYGTVSSLTEMTKIDVNPNGGIAIDPEFLVEFSRRRPHQVRLEGGDASSDSYCYP